ncbi:hypothetical protein ABIB42_005158, partial [Massilia sp. UYP32]
YRLLIFKDQNSVLLLAASLRIVVFVSSREARV